MSGRIRAWILALVSLGGAARAAAGEEPAAPQWKFAWTVPSRVRVTETVEKKGKKALLTYTARLAAGAGGRLELQLTDLKVVQGPGMEQLAVPLELVDMVLPTLVLSRAGEVEDIIGVEGAIDAVLAIKADGSDPAVARAVKAALTSPQMLAALKRKSGEFWEVWVGLWIDLDLAPGQEFTADVALPMPDGTSLRSPTRLRHLGADPVRKGHVRLAMDALLEGPEATASIARLILSLVNAVPSKGTPVTEDMIESVKRETHLSVTTDPGTLRPLEARSEVVFTINVKGEAPRTQVERRTYTFDWTPRP